MARNPKRLTLLTHRHGRDQSLSLKISEITTLRKIDVLKTSSKQYESQTIEQIKPYLKMFEGLCSESMINFISQHLSLSKQISLLSPKLFAFSWWDARMTRTMNSLNSYWKLFLTKQHLQQLVTGSPGRTGAGPLAKICPNWRRRGPIQPTQKVTWAKNRLPHMMISRMENDFVSHGVQGKVFKPDSWTLFLSFANFDETTTESLLGSSYKLCCWVNMWWPWDESAEGRECSKQRRLREDCHFWLRTGSHLGNRDNQKIYITLFIHISTYVWYNQKNEYLYENKWEWLRHT